MKHLVALSVTGFLFLGACSPQQQAPQESAAKKDSLQTENSEIAGGEKPSEFDRNITDPQIAAGEEIYERSCAGCHDSGTGGAPKPGSKEDWTARVGLGLEVLTKKSIDGFEGKQGAMPPRGGNAELSDAEVTNAVRYMLARSM
jgi:cytochrome c5